MVGTRQGALPRGPRPVVCVVASDIVQVTGALPLGAVTMFWDG